MGLIAILSSFYMREMYKAYFSNLIPKYTVTLDVNGEKYLLQILGKRGSKYGKCWVVSKNGEIIWSSKFGCNPWKIEVGEIDGDSEVEIGVGVWKKTKFHPVFANRIFIYSWRNNHPVPKWFGSRVTHELIDFTFVDLDGDGIDELVTLEGLGRGKKVLMWYKWEHFSFVGWYLCKGIKQRDELVMKLVKKIRMKKLPEHEDKIPTLKELLKNKRE